MKLVITRADIRLFRAIKWPLAFFLWSMAGFAAAISNVEHIGSSPSPVITLSPFTFWIIIGLTIFAGISAMWLGIAADDAKRAEKRSCGAGSGGRR